MSADKPDRLQKSRFELKYVIEERVAQQVRDFVAERLELDEFGIGKENQAYPVNSLYLDGEKMRTFWEWVNANRNRFKLRVRFYSENGDDPVFLELKRRISSCIVKERCGVRRTAVPFILAGQIPPPKEIVSKDAKHLVALQNFVHVTQRLRAQPEMLVTYLRQAYLDVETNSVRVTFDRLVRVSRRKVPDFSLAVDRYVQPFGNKVILEIKFTNRFPDWLGEMVRTFALQREGAAKYCEGVAAFLHPQFSNWREMLPQRLPGPVYSAHD